MNRVSLLIPLALLAPVPACTAPAGSLPSRCVAIEVDPTRELVVTGLYPRLDAAHFGPVRIVVEAPIIWYPDLRNTDNWVLARPDVRAEAKAGDFRVHVSLGAMAAKMIGAAPVPGPIAAYGGGGLPSGVQDGAIWNTAGAGVALSVSPTTSVFAEGFLILHGVQLAGPEWFDLPCGVFLGVATRL